MPRISASHRPVFLLNSCLDLFSAPRPIKAEDPFSRSYGVNLPSSLTVNLSSALVYSTRPPVSVYGTGPQGLRRRQRIFSGVCSSMIITWSRRTGVLSGFAGYVASVSSHATSVQRAIRSARTRFAPPSPRRLALAGLRNIDRMSIHVT